MKIKRGKDLKVGDHIKVWWKPNVDVITSLEPYKSPVKGLEKCFLAEFAISKVGMTIIPDDVYEVVA